jgi:hypothetical protein
VSCENTTIILGNPTHIIIFYANDTAGNINSSGGIYFFIADSDGDGVIDSNDTLLGNASDVITSGITDLNITIGGDQANGTFEGVQEVVIYAGSSPLINFSYNFSTGTLDLGKISIYLTETSLVINLSDQLQGGFNKTLYIRNSQFTSLCVKDAEIASLNEFSSGCNGANEYDFTSCLGDEIPTTEGTVVCSETNGTISVSGLNHSAILASQATPITQIENSENTPSKNNLQLLKSFNCSSGQLVVSAISSGNGVSGLTVKLFNTWNYDYTQAKTDSNGDAVFTVSASGKYEAYTSTTNKYFPYHSDPFELDLCPGQNQSTGNNQTQNQGTENQIQNQTTITQINQTNNQNQTEPRVNQTLASAQNALDLANNAILAASGKDTSSAKAKLNEANAAFDAGNYELAKQLAEEAKQLALNAKPLSGAPQTNQIDSTAQQQTQKGFDWGWVVIGLVVILVVAGGYYLLAKKTR